MKRIALIFICALLSRGAIAQVSSDAAIRKILVERVDTQRRSTGLVVGVIESGGSRVISHGEPAVDGDALFEIGSITKVFTALLLADMVEKGEVALSDPVVKYLPESVKMPKTITLEHLATHTSGLPRLPGNLFPRDPANPYGDYTVAQLHEFLSSVKPAREPGEKYEYSNVGAGLLGHALARRAGMDYETLVRTRILEPLGMKSTAITLSKELKARLVAGNDENLKPVANWDLPALAGAGALRSTANDMLKFTSAALGHTKSPLSKAFATMLAARRPTGNSGTDIALGWHISAMGGRDIVWHDGGTGGYRSYLALDPKNRTGVIVLSNTSTTAGVNDIGLHLLNPASPLMKAARTEIKVVAAVLEKYAGVYELAPGMNLIVTRTGEQLFAQVTGQGKVEIYPETTRDFFYKVVDAQITFAEDGKRLVLHQNGRDVPAGRIADAPPPRKEHAVVPVDPKVLDRYVGRYELAPEFVLTVTREENRLFVQATAQPKFEVFAKSDREFFYKVVEATLTFAEDGSSVVLHQNGMEMPGKRVD